MAKVIVEERKTRAAEQGVTLTDEQLNAPLSPAETKRVQRAVRDNTGKSVSSEEVQQRVESMVTY